MNSANNDFSAQEEETALGFLAIDDTLFESNETDKSSLIKNAKQTNPTVPTMEPKIIEGGWFMACEEVLLTAQGLKNKADFLFYNKDYTGALALYQRCLSAVPKSNATLLRDAQEAMIWCLAKSNKGEDAKRAASDFSRDLIASTSCPEQRTPALFLNIRLHLSCGCVEELTKALKSGICVQPLFAEWWQVLGETYAQRRPEVDDSNHCSLAGTCFGVAATLARRQTNWSTSFSKRRLLEVCTTAEMLADGKAQSSRVNQFVENLAEGTSIALTPTTFDDTLSKLST